jgi:U4/U6.U5 tri-snRNP-associated protein 1
MNLVLSVEATNRLRAQLGLKLIPVEANVQRNRNEANAKTGSSVVEGLMEISIADTNELRKKIGLKLIPDDSEAADDVANYRKLERQRQDAIERENLISGIQESKQAMLYKQRVQKGGILDRLNQSDAALDLNSWLDKVGKETGNKRLSFKKKKKTDDSKDIHLENGADEDDIKIAHTRENLDRISGTNETGGVVLTLKDSNVLDESPDELENVQLKYHEQVEARLLEKGAVGKLVSMDNGVGSKRKFDTLSIDLSDEENDNILNYDENTAHQKKLSGFMKRDVSKFKKSKKAASKAQERRKVFDTELEEKEFKPVILNDDDDDTSQVDEDDLEVILNKARQSKLKFPKVTDEQIGNRSGGEDGVASAATSTKEVIDESLEFLDRLDSAVANSDVTQERERLPQELRKLPTAEASPSAIPDGINQKTSTAASRYRDILESGNPENKSSYGVSSVLNSLRSNRVPSNNKGKAGSDEVTLVYTDDDGKVLNTAEAFKYMSRKFHGSKKR